MNPEIIDIHNVLSNSVFSFFSILIVAYFLSNSRKLYNSSINFNFMLWPVAIISFFTAINFYAISIESEDFYLTIANSLYVSSAAFLVMLLIDIEKKLNKKLIFFILITIIIAMFIYDYFRRFDVVQLRHSAVSFILAAIYLLGFILTFKSFWKKSILQNLKFISITLLFSVLFYCMLFLISISAYFYSEWLVISDLIFSKGFRAIAAALNIFLFLLIGNYLFEQVLILESKKSVDSEMQMLDSLNALAFARDNETGNHIIRTQKYVEKLASRLSKLKHYSKVLNEISIGYLYNAAPLHDIGKVGIPDSILLKPAKLTDSEWEVMKTHTTIGENVLSSAEMDARNKSPILLFANEIAGGHHEKWDGSGYPRGLSGLDIPLSARIMSLADMYDALLSKRVYKEAWSHEDAAKEIQSRSGSHFDPEIVDAFMAEKDAFLEISIQYQD